jgi:hypothetical protein
MDISFKTWFEINTVGTKFVDESKIDSIYDKAKISVQLVQMFNEKLLYNINTIIPLQSGVYGLYNSAKNQKVIDQNEAEKIRLKFGKDVIEKNQIDMIPNVVLKQKIPNIDLNKIHPSDTIEINVSRILREFGNTKRAVIEIASTIVHEATHENELQTKGSTNEIGPKAAEMQFMNWVKANKTTIDNMLKDLPD